MFEAKYKALSIRQPWATLITIGLPVYDSILNKDGTSRVEFRGKVLIKDIENRKWPLPKWFETPQRIYVHAGKGEDNSALEWLLSQGFPAFPVLMMFTRPKGAIVGEIDILDCVTESDSPWFQGPYGFILANPMPYRDPIPCKGKLGFFTPELTEVNIFKLA